MLTPQARSAPLRMETIAAQKSAIRQRIIARRRQMGAAARAAASAIICDKIKELPQYRQARCVAAFAAMPEEVDIWPLISDSLQSNKTVALPRVSDPKQHLLTFHDYRGDSELVDGYRGILEPPPEEKIINTQLFDFIIIPAVSIDSCRLRLGYGGGFYDKVLVNCSAAYSCAAIFRCQLSDALPFEKHDQPINTVITE